jgi:hypothetical protein
MRRVQRGAALVAVLLLADGCGGGETPAQEDRAADASEAAACAEHNPERDVYWGDLHVHTALSSDAWRSNVRTTPDDAYRFARGEEIFLAPLDSEGNGTRSVRLERPLDFAAVTDHAETLGVMALCADPASDSYDSQACDFFRRLPSTPAYPRDPDVPPRGEIYAMLCGEDGSSCRAAAQVPWQTTLAAAARWNDTSPTCEFTTFNAYEWSGARGGPLLHRNVIFRNDATAPPVSSSYWPRPWDLFRQLQADCLEANSGCDVLAIPHNSNTSQGQMFVADYPGANDATEEAAMARVRAALEPVIEIMQHKGDSECRNGLSGVLGDPDELCDFEKLFPAELPQCDGSQPVEMGEVYCTDVGGYARTGLGVGLLEERRLGVNPFQFGFIASTDTHNATSGQVNEATWKGHVGDRDSTPGTRMGYAGRGRPNTINNPGGIAAVWAEENSREALFLAIRRRETYGTSGPRITLRFFAGWDYPDDLCGRDDFASQGYAGGVPMGGVLPEKPKGDSAPTFALQALRDPGTAAHPGGLLQRAQIVKLSTDNDGNIHQRVFDIAGDADSGADVDLASCQPRGPGADSLCSVWRDPEFDSSLSTVYYARVVENPSCRWDQRECLALAADERPDTCNDEITPATIQERAWTSPIWYAP